ncbi:hypothetical protein WMF36_07165 [Sorangium sp. So ce887]
MPGSSSQEPAGPPGGSRWAIPLAQAGGLRTGRWVRYPSLSHNNLLVSILNLFGDPRTTFGAPEHCTGPLTNLT